MDIKKNKFGFMTALCLILAVAFQLLVTFINAVETSFSARFLFCFIGYLPFAICLIMNKKGIATAVTAGITLLPVLAIAFLIIKDLSIDSFYEFITFVFFLLSVLAMILLFFFTLTISVESLSKYRDYVKKLWFLPLAVIVATTLLTTRTPTVLVFPITDFAFFLTDLFRICFLSYVFFHTLWLKQSLNGAPDDMNKAIYDFEQRLEVTDAPLFPLGKADRLLKIKGDLKSGKLTPEAAAKETEAVFNGKEGK